MTSLVPLLLNGRKKVYATMLTLVFIGITLDLAIAWHNLQRIISIHQYSDSDGIEIYSVTLLPNNNAQTGPLNLIPWMTMLLADTILACSPSLNSVPNFF